MRGGHYAKFEPVTQRGPLWLRRLRLVIAREPWLELSAIAERFGLTEEQARALARPARRSHVRHGDRRIL